VVQSDEWVVRRDEQQEEFRGHVRLDHAPHHLEADWALFQRPPGLWKVRGRVHLRRDLPEGETWQAWGDEGEYRLGSKKGELWGTQGPLRITRSFSDSTGTHLWTGSARKAEWDGQAQVLHLIGDVGLDAADVKVRSARARYDAASRSASFEGHRPVAQFEQEGFGCACQSDRLQVQDSPRKLVASGRVRGWFHLKPKPTEEIKGLRD